MLESELGNRNDVAAAVERSEPDRAVGTGQPESELGRRSVVGGVVGSGSRGRVVGVGRSESERVSRSGVARVVESSGPTGRLEKERGNRAGDAGRQPSQGPEAQPDGAGTKLSEWAAWEKTGTVPDQKTGSAKALTNGNGSSSCESPSLCRSHQDRDESRGRPTDGSRR